MQHLKTPRLSEDELSTAAHYMRSRNLYLDFREQGVLACMFPNTLDKRLMLAVSYDDTETFIFTCTAFIAAFFNNCNEHEHFTKRRRIEDTTDPDHNEDYAGDEAEIDVALNASTLRSNVFVLRRSARASGIGDADRQHPSLTTVSVGYQFTHVLRLLDAWAQTAVLKHESRKPPKAFVFRTSFGEFNPEIQPAVQPSVASEESDDTDTCVHMHEHLKDIPFHTNVHILRVRGVRTVTLHLVLGAIVVPHIAFLRACRAFYAKRLTLSVDALRSALPHGAFYSNTEKAWQPLHAVRAQLLWDVVFRQMEELWSYEQISK